MISSDSLYTCKVIIITCNILSVQYIDLTLVYLTLI